MKKIIKLKRISLVAMLVFLMLLGSVSQAFAVSKVDEKANDNITLLLYSNAYDEVTESAETSIIDQEQEIKNNNEKIKQYLKMNEKAFKKLAYDKLKTVLEEQKNGKNIIWNKDFAENVVKNEFPDLYPIIMETISRQASQQVSSTSQDVSASSLPDYTTRTFDHTKYDALGLRIAKLSCTITWNWDSAHTRVTSATPSTSQYTYMAGWNSTGYTYNRQSYGPNNAWFRKEIEGEWKLIVNGTTLQTGYIWLDISVYPNGGSAKTSGTRP